MASFPFGEHDSTELVFLVSKDCYQNGILIPALLNPEDISPERAEINAEFSVLGA